MSEDEYIEAVEQLYADGRPAAPEGVRLVDEAVAQFPRSAEMWLLRAEVLQVACIEEMRARGKANFTEADRCFRVALELDPTSSECWFEWGAFLDAIDELDDAEAAYRRALELGETRESFIGLARVLVQQERWGEVLDLLDPDACPYGADDDVAKIRTTVARWMADPEGSDHPADAL